ncbi:MAG: HesB/IscA family protein [Bdellovibrionales bacterium]
MITVTDSALKQISTIKSSESRSDSDFLRINVKRGGCSGFSYKLDFDTETTDKDKSFEPQEGLKIVIDSQSLLYIMGMSLDFEGGLNGQGFVFSNPNATKTCGCGSSFAV